MSLIQFSNDERLSQLSEIERSGTEVGGVIKDVSPKGACWMSDIWFRTEGSKTASALAHSSLFPAMSRNMSIQVLIAVVIARFNVGEISVLVIITKRVVIAMNVWKDPKPLMYQRYGFNWGL